MELAVANLFGYRANLIVPNISYGAGLHECDLLMIRRSGYGAEIEIKISKWDLKRDKDKQHGHESDKIKEFYYAITPELYGTALRQRQDAGIILCRKQMDGTYKAELVKKPIQNNKARKWTEEEYLQVARLGCMRIWSQKQDVIKLKKELKKYKR